MSIENLIGSIHQISDFDATTVEWKIDKFLSTMSEKQGTNCHSPFFTFNEACCFLVIQPKTFRSDCYVRLRFHIQKKFGHNIICVVSFKNAIGRLEKVVQFTHESNDDSFDSKWQKLCKTSELKRRMEELLPAGILTIHFKVNKEELPFVPITRSECLASLSRDMKGMLTEKKNTDVVFKFKEREILAHKSILVSRSEYFRTMFDHGEVVESQTGVIAINDIEPEVFQLVLSYIYCGEVEELSPENMCQLYLAADKYRLSILKKLCMTFMGDNMTVDIFCDIYAIADTCGDTALLQNCKHFFALFHEHIMKTEKWKSFHEGNTKLAFQLLHSVVEENGLKLPFFRTDAHYSRDRFSAEWNFLMNNLCYTCGRPGHYRRNCEYSRGGVGEQKCHLCEEVGHFYRDCPDRNGICLCGGFSPRNANCPRCNSI